MRANIWPFQRAKNNQLTISREKIYNLFRRAHLDVDANQRCIRKCPITPAFHWNNKFKKTSHRNIFMTKNLFLSSFIWDNTCKQTKLSVSTLIITYPHVKQIETKYVHFFNRKFPTFPMSENIFTMGCRDFYELRNNWFQCYMSCRGEQRAQSYRLNQWKEFTNSICLFILRARAKKFARTSETTNCTHVFLSSHVAHFTANHFSDKAHHI